MKPEQVSELLEEYERLFQLDEVDSYHEFESQMSDILFDEAEKVSSNSSDEKALLGFRKKILRGISEHPQLARLVEIRLEDFGRQVDTGTRDFTEYGSEEPMEDDDVELLFETLSLWSSTPHRLVKEHWDLVKKAAVKFHEPTRVDSELEFDDLLSVCGEGLMAAAEKMYESPRENFRKFAMQVLKDKVKNYQANKHPVPLKVRKKLEKLRDERESSGISGSDSKSLESLSNRLGYSEHEMKGLFEVESVWGTGHFVDLGDKMEELEVPDLSPDALSLLIDQETTMRMSEAMTNLSEVQRNVVLQIYFRDMSFRQTAELLKISLSVVKKHHRNAMMKLKGHIE